MEKQDDLKEEHKLKREIMVFICAAILVLILLSILNIVITDERNRYEDAMWEYYSTQHTEKVIRHNVKR